MIRNGRWALLAALASGVAIGSAFAWTRRQDRRLDARRQHKTRLQEWQGEGGSLAAPMPAPART